MADTVITLDKLSFTGKNEARLICYVFGLIKIISNMSIRRLHEVVWYHLIWLCFAKMMSSSRMVQQNPWQSTPLWWEMTSDDDDLC